RAVAGRDQPPQLGDALRARPSAAHAGAELELRTQPAQLGLGPHAEAVADVDDGAARAGAAGRRVRALHPCALGAGGGAPAAAVDGDLSAEIGGGVDGRVPGGRPGARLEVEVVAVAVA